MNNDKTISYADVIRTSNEWMRRYIEEPERFEREFRSVTKFLADQNEGRVPDYGERCAAYQFELLDELNSSEVFS